jgi:hypothetical protein
LMFPSFAPLWASRRICHIGTVPQPFKSY